MSHHCSKTSNSFFVILEQNPKSLSEPIRPQMIQSLASLLMHSLHSECSSPRCLDGSVSFLPFKSALNVTFSDKLSLVILYFFPIALITKQYYIMFLFICLFLSLLPKSITHQNRVFVCFTPVSPAPSMLPGTLQVLNSQSMSEVK